MPSRGPGRRLSEDSGLRSGVVPGFALLGLRLGPAFVCATTAAVHGLEHHDAGLASGLVSTAHELGASLGVAVIATIAGAGVASADHGTVTPATGGFDDAFTACAIIAASAAAAAFVLLPPGRPDPSAGPVTAH